MKPFTQNDQVRVAAAVGKLMSLGDEETGTRLANVTTEGGVGCVTVVIVPGMLELDLPEEDKTSGVFDSLPGDPDFRK